MHVSALFNFCWHPLPARANERTRVPLFIWIAIVKNRSFMHIVKQSFPPRCWNKFRKFFYVSKRTEKTRWKKSSAYFLSNPLYTHQYGLDICVRPQKANIILNKSLFCLQPVDLSKLYDQMHVAKYIYVICRYVYC